MAQYTLTVVDTTQIQPYVFGSNRLQENIGASELVRLATGEWALQAVTEVVAEDNIADPVEAIFKKDFEIEKVTEAKAAEVIYSGGGNIVVLFSDANLAKEFAGKLTRKVLRCAPGLSLVIAHEDFIWNQPEDNERALSETVTKLLRKTLAARKASRLPSQPLLGLGVTAACESTGMVAFRANEGKFSPPGEDKTANLKLKNDEPTRLISREVACKLWARDLANRRLKSLFAKELSNWYDFPSDMDKLGRIKGEESYVAVVHGDGNRMGNHLQAIADEYRIANQNRQYIKELRIFSQSVQDSAEAALRHIIKLLTDRITLQQGKEFVAEQVPMERTFLPFRPLVFGGDDVTFVCNGHLGLSLAAEYLKAYEEQTEKHPGRRLTARAGIAIVKMHYPFARAYELSGKLADAAKYYLREKFGDQTTASALDWHIATSGLSGSLDVIRRREYQNHDRSRTLLMRPVLLKAKDTEQEGRVWLDGIERLVREFQGGDDWADKRNKVKMLRGALREGLTGRVERIENLLQIFGLPLLPEVIRDSNAYRSSGWQGERCGYFDAIELSDFYVHLPLGE
jgi:hypothetical protein